jgi:hypothetical protein
MDAIILELTSSSENLTHAQRYGYASLLNDQIVLPTHWRAI